MIPEINKMEDDELIELATAILPEIAKALLLYPDEPGKDYAGDYHWWRTDGEKIPFCGGNWNYSGTAGVFIVNASNPRSNSTSYLGLRSAYCDL